MRLGWVKKPYKDPKPSFSIEALISRIDGLEARAKKLECKHYQHKVKYFPGYGVYAEMVCMECDKVLDYYVNRESYIKSRLKHYKSALKRLEKTKKGKPS